MNELAEVVHPLLELVRLVFRKVGTILFTPPYPHFYDGQHRTLSSCRETSRRRAAPLSSWVHVGLIQNVTAAGQKKSTDLNILFALPHKPRFVRFKMPTTNFERQIVTSPDLWEGEPIWLITFSLDVL
jgi:hypothetical protein